MALNFTPEYTSPSGDQWSSQGVPPQFMKGLTSLTPLANLDMQGNYYEHAPSVSPLRQMSEPDTLSPLMGNLAGKFANFGLNNLASELDLPSLGDFGGYGGVAGILASDDPMGAAGKFALNKGAEFGLNQFGFGDAVPFAAPVIQALSGDPKGAIFTGVGTALGGPIGGMIGSVVGSLFGDCFITTAVMLANGNEDDNAPELTAMRKLRDEFIIGVLGEQEIVDEYYEIAPMIVEAVNQRPDAQEIYLKLYHKYIQPAANAVINDDFVTAMGLYLDMIEFVVPFAEMVVDEQTGQVFDHFADSASELESRLGVE